MNSEDVYRQAEGVNWSTLKHMKESPLDYRLARDYSMKTSDAMRLGSFIDCALLTPDEIPERYLVVPEIVGWRTKEDKQTTLTAYSPIFEQAGLGGDEIASCLKLKKEDFMDFIRRAVQHTGKIPIPEGGTNPREVFTYHKGMKIAEQNRDKTHLRKALEASEGVQVPLYATCPVTGLKLKGLVDILTKNSITDLKTIGVMGKVWYNMRAFDYPGQLAYYDYLAQLNGKGRENHYLIFIQTTSPHKMKVVQVEPRCIAKEQEAIIELLKKVAECEANNYWPDGSDEIEVWEDRSESLPSESESLERMEEEGEDTL